ncbi:MAG: tRNA (adenosine(37)-N6)-threonylcarbamoyltransferase complex dimerization subunit type 1 TsaB [Bacteroides sp.]|nr:tRNA (adenosine(37)-N6)-threonylcarbamoyltransferase complex dimerization subunit type 1 TsaB [Bacteroides sp.]MBD5297875.1 tRNA (adenosine(37)-N6)-threonylcarbamoyltransferase complex dimerization subunit type 1 TsaB [Bacteroides sp.]MBD5319654.1 tRNA (adenosine(37)-N6)-threonylcarbamoyltransferase complex dimerization subunit type 1 TsaB [Bacteroides sp.]
MAVILNIETSTTVCSAALTAEGMVLCHFEDFKGQNHAALLSGFIKRCLDHARDHEMKLDAIAVSTGPGSYTGLRIGLSEAKGLAFALDIPLIGVDTLQLLAVSAMFNHDIDPDALLVPMIDARRMEVYTAVYDFALTPLLSPQPLILDTDSYSQWLSEGRPMVFFGNGSDKARDVITSPLARFIPDIVPLASDMLALAERAWMNRQFLDLAYSTPAYLKEFQATKPKSRLQTP